MDGPGGALRSSEEYCTGKLLDDLPGEKEGHSQSQSQGQVQMKILYTGNSNDESRNAQFDQISTIGVCATAYSASSTISRWAAVGKGSKPAPVTEILRTASEISFAHEFSSIPPKP